MKGAVGNRHLRFRTASSVARERQINRTDQSRIGSINIGRETFDDLAIATDQEFFEIAEVATLVGGTIVIPHLRRAVEFWDELKKN